MAIIEGEGRKAPASDAERATLLSNMFAYSGSYKVDGDSWTTEVDVAWNPAWRGTKQLRKFELSGDRLTVTSMWGPDPNHAGAPIIRNILVFERSK